MVKVNAKELRGKKKEDLRKYLETQKTELSSRRDKKCRSLKPGMVVLVLRGKYAERKAIVVKAVDDGAADRPYPHAIIAGIGKYPRSINKTMGKKKQEKRSKLKPFLKVSSYGHLLPTRHSVNVNFDNCDINKESLTIPKRKRRALHKVKSKFEEHYKTGRNKWFFTR